MRDRREDTKIYWDVDDSLLMWSFITIIIYTNNMSLVLFILMIIAKGTWPLPSSSSLSSFPLLILLSSFSLNFVVEILVFLLGERVVGAWACFTLWVYEGGVPCPLLPHPRDLDLRLRAPLTSRLVRVPPGRYPSEVRPPRVPVLGRTTDPRPRRPKIGRLDRVPLIEVGERNLVTQGHRVSRTFRVWWYGHVPVVVQGLSPGHNQLWHVQVVSDSYL